ncbi:hypothetical protein [Photobacterium damselae]|uniref:hypothetical protein n=1 Tax=Photobacterium damselae TaxID=38293 RepID=UPI00165E3C14|nr:hypothetical protein [Photobacterium damselae]
MVVKIVNEIISILKFFAMGLIFRRRIYKNRYSLKNKINSQIHIFGNGPSLYESKKNYSKNDDLIMVNFSALTDDFFDLKPKYLCIADQDFFYISKIKSKELKLRMNAWYSRLENVDWNLTIVVPSEFKGLLNIKNDHVNILVINTLPLPDKFIYFRYYMYKFNYAAPKMQNVVIFATYFAIQVGYNKIFLHGVDSDSFKDVFINKKNEMVLIDKHFYGNKEINLSKQYSYLPGSFYKKLQADVNMFKSYYDLRLYSDKINVEIINYSKNSMIDSFSRL